MKGERGTWRLASSLRPSNVHQVAASWDGATLIDQFDLPRQLQGRRIQPGQQPKKVDVNIDFGMSIPVSFRSLRGDLHLAYGVDPHNNVGTF